MLYEFALEPAVMCGWQNFRYFSEKFGVEHGRLIGQFPKRWKREVYEACKFCDDVERKRIEERLRQATFDHKLIRSSRLYDPDQPWLPNVESQQASDSSFRLVIATDNPRSHPDVRCALELDEHDPRWAVDREMHVARSALSLAGCAESLLRISREILIVDPYFDPQHDRFCEVLAAFLHSAELERRVLRRLELHSSNRRSGTTDHWTAQCHRWLPPLIPRGQELRVVRWSQRPGGEHLHARYVLTERGGLAFDVGTDEGEPGETTDVRLLTASLYRARWSEYPEAGATRCEQAPAFEMIDELLIEGTGE